MRTVYLGTSDFAVTILRRLAESPHAPELVVTRPDRPRGRGRKLTPPPVADAARELGLELFQPDSVNSEEAVARIGAVRPEAMCLCAFGALIKEPLLSDHVIFNVHPSLLPRWRGAAPVERAIMAGDAGTGVTIMRLTAGLDSGPICAQAPEPISAQDTYGTLAPRLAELGGRLLIGSLSGDVHWTEQDDALATYAEKIEAADRRLDPVARPRTSSSGSSARSIRTSGRSCCSTTTCASACTGRPSSTRGLSRPGSSGWTVPGRSSVARRARSSCSSSSRPAAAP